MRSFCLSLSGINSWYFGKVLTILVARFPAPGLLLGGYGLWTHIKQKGPHNVICTMWPRFVPPPNAHTLTHSFELLKEELALRTQGTYKDTFLFIEEDTLLRSIENPQFRYDSDMRPIFRIVSSFARPMPNVMASLVQNQEDFFEKLSIVNAEFIDLISSFFLQVANDRDAYLPPVKRSFRPPSWLNQWHFYLSEDSSIDLNTPFGKPLYVSKTFTYRLNQEASLDRLILPTSYPQNQYVFQPPYVKGRFTMNPMDTELMEFFVRGVLTTVGFDAPPEFHHSIAPLVPSPQNTTEAGSDISVLGIASGALDMRMLAVDDINDGMLVCVSSFYCARTYELLVRSARLNFLRLNTMLETFEESYLHFCNRFLVKVVDFFERHRIPFYIDLRTVSDTSSKSLVLRIRRTRKRFSPMEFSIGLLGHGLRVEKIQTPSPLSSDSEEECSVNAIPSFNALRLFLSL